MLDRQNMPKVSDSTVAYVAFSAFCILSSVRDVISEIVFKDQAYDASPIFVLFVYSVVTQCVAGTFLFANRSADDARKIISGHTADVVRLNVFTLAAFFFYFLAINSPLGAATNAFIDYGSTPVFTALVGALLAREELDRTFAVSATVSVIGIAVLGAPRIWIDQFSMLWIAGLTFSLLSSISSAFYRVYFRLLLLTGAPKSSIIFFRLFGVTFALGTMLLIRPDLLRLDLLPQIALVGFVGFTLPLFLTLTIIQNVTIRTFSMMLFLAPATTFLLSASLGYARFYISDILAAVLLVLGVVFHERRKGSDQRIN